MLFSLLHKNKRCRKKPPNSETYPKNNSRPFKYVASSYGYRHSCALHNVPELKLLPAHILNAQPALMTQTI